MTITELSVKKPLGVLMIVLLFVGLGALGYSKLGADLFPSVNYPIISVVTRYDGASTEEVEKNVVKPVEESISAVSGIDKIYSGSLDGLGYTVIQFKMETNMDTAFMDVQKALGDISNKLPEGASKPILKKADEKSEPIMMLALSGSTPYDELYNAADRLKQSLEKLPGVSSVVLQGAAKKQLGIKIDRESLDHYGVSINTILNKLKSENINIPSGEINTEKENQPIRVIGEFKDISEVKNLQIPITDETSIPLSELAEVDMVYPKNSSSVRMNKSTSIGVFVYKQSDANIVQTTEKIKNELERTKKSLPKDSKISVANDSSRFINSTLKEIKSNLIEGIITTTIVMFLFLRHLKSSIIVLIAIPTALVSTFFMMYVLGFTLNLLTLLALSLSIGILVDDSIVVLENIQRHLKQGKNLKTAAIEGRKEVSMAAIAITLCDVVVFGPVAFMSGITGKYFREFGLTVVFAALFSLIVSFTVTPMLASRLLTEEKNEIDKKEKVKAPGIFSNLFVASIKKYKRFLAWSLENRWKVVSTITLTFVMSVALIPMGIISAEFLPSMDQGRFSVNIKLKPGSTINQTNEKAKAVEQYISGLEEVKDYITMVGTDNSYSAKIVVNLVDKKERKKSEAKMVQEAREWGKKMTGVDFTVNNSSLFDNGSGGGYKPISINITGSNPKVLAQLAGEVEKFVKSVPGVTDVGNSLRDSSSEINIKIDRLALAKYHISPADIAGTLNVVGDRGTKAGVFRKDGDEYDVVVKFKDKQVITTNDISNLNVTSASGNNIPLSQVAQVSINDSSKEKKRIDRQGRITIDANIEGRPLGSVSKDITEKLKAISLPYGYNINYAGDQEEMDDAFSALVKALVASVVLVYMILVVLYESFLTPFLRMLSLPCGFIGAFLIMALTGKSLNIITMIGFIMLDGLASKNGTLLIDYTNNLMRTGVPLKEALLEAGVTRLRPIIMTTITMIVGMLPSALALGEGSELKSGMSIVLIGGMITSLILSPILIPVAYTIMDDLKNFIARKRRKNITLNGGETI